jgi:hypothetical protein
MACLAQGMEGIVAYHVKVIPPSGRARIHEASCKFCREGQGMENQDIGEGPTYWYPPYPTAGFNSIADAQSYRDDLGSRYTDVGMCQYCLKERADAHRS